MRYRQLDLNLLLALEALLETASVTAAAERLNLTQAATSNALARLRTYFDDPLLVRMGRRMVLTKRAHAVQAEVADVLHRIETRILTPPAFDPTAQQRHFSVQASDAISPALLAQVGQRLHHQAPGLKLTIRPLAEDPGLALDRGDADLLVIPRQHADAAHPTCTLYTEGFVVIAWAQSAHAASPLTIEAYLAADHVKVESGAERRDSFDQRIADQTLGQLKATITVASQALVAWHVLGTDRLGTLPAVLGQTLAASLPLVAHPLPVAVPPLELVLQWSRYTEDDAALRWLREVIAETAGHSPD